MTLGLIVEEEMRMAIRKEPSIVYWLGDNLYLNITNRCTNNCYFCLRNFWNGVGGFNLKLEKDPTINEILSALQNVINLRYWKEIVFCGFGEPLMRLDCILEVSKYVRKNYGRIVTIRVDTNGHGYLLNKGRRVAEELNEAGVNKLSVSLNAHDRETYLEICRPSIDGAFEAVLDFVERAKNIIDVEVTAVAVPEVDLKKFEELAKKLGVKYRIRQYIPCFW